MNSQTENRVSSKPTKRGGWGWGDWAEFNLQRAAFAKKSPNGQKRLLSFACNESHFSSGFCKEPKGHPLKTFSPAHVILSLFFTGVPCVCTPRGLWHRSSVTWNEYSMVLPTLVWRGSPSTLLCSYMVMGPPEFTSTDGRVHQVPKAPMAVGLNIHTPLCLIYMPTRLCHLQR